MFDESQKTIAYSAPAALRACRNTPEIQIGPCRVLLHIEDGKTIKIAGGPLDPKFHARENIVIVHHQRNGFNADNGPVFRINTVLEGNDIG